MGIKLFHKGKRNIHGIAKDANGDPAPFVFKPQTAIEFDEETGAKLRRLYGNEIISMDDVQKQFDQSTAVKDNAPVNKTPHGSDTPTEKEVPDPALAVEAEVQKRTYDALVAAGLTEDEARAAVWPEPKAEAAKDATGGAADLAEKVSVLQRLGIGHKKA